MSIEYKEEKELGSCVDSVFNTTSTHAVSKKLLKILLISENSSDIYMIKKLLPKTEGYMIYEAVSLSSALKVMSYLNLDLILIDDMLCDIDGYDVVSKLNNIDISKEIPKILLLTTDYKSDKKETFHAENLDYVKKPLDKVIFKLRVTSLIKNSDDRLDRKSYFKNLALQKFDEAQSFSNIYQEIFESSESIMCIYDSENEKIVESNAIFEKFFLNLHSFNRIISNPHLARKFVPFKDEANYLNYYHPKEWMKTLIEGGDFNYLVKLQRDFKEYSFTINVKKIMPQKRGIYLIKLSNIYDYLPQNSNQINDTKLTLREKNLEVFKDDFLALRKLLRKQAVKDEKMTLLLYQLSTKLSIICDDASIITDKKDDSNLFEIIVLLLKDRFMQSNIYVNNKKVDKFLEENSETYLATVDEDAIEDLLFGLLRHCYGEEITDSSENKRVDIMLTIEGRDVILKITSNLAMDINADADTAEDEIINSLPKNMKQALLRLDASIGKWEENNHSTYLIKIPL